jgi:chromosome segregation ATPase
MGNIYKSLSDLMERNKHIFDFLRKKPAEGLYKAIWESRDSEINELKQNIQTLEVKQEKLTEQTQKIQILEKDEVTSLQIIEGLKEKNFSLRDQVSTLHQKNQEFEENLRMKDTFLTKAKIDLSDTLSKVREMTTDLKKAQEEEINLIKLMREKERNFLDIAKDYEDKIENGIKDRDRITKALTKEIKEVSTLYKIEMLKVQELKEQINKTKVELSNERTVAHHLKDEVSKIKENARRYHALNHRMEEELKRIDHDLNSLG